MSNCLDEMEGVWTAETSYREQIIAGQLEQAQKWHPDRARQAMVAWLHTL